MGTTLLENCYSLPRIRPTEKEWRSFCDDSVPPLPGGRECVWERGLGGEGYQILQTFSGSLTMGCPGLHWKAVANSGMFTTTPLIRYCTVEWGFTLA